ncbi:hypothetical protein ACFVT5_24760 [Streptomyces sp. NPDC058001]|uniref:hypothetical protein n=1 Tax=Streptomyces sp. NPDC058001 TaxID=3346300 RepID=UPI0036F0A1DB
MSTERGDQDATGTRTRTRRSPLTIVSVAAAVLLAGGGGMYLATASDSGHSDGKSGTPGGDGPVPPPLALDGYAGAPAGTGSTPPGIAPGEPDPNGTTYRATGTLPDGPGSAAVYRPGGEVGAGEVTRLARALGLEGTPLRSGDAWRMGGAKDGSGPALRVSVKAPGTWTFSRYAPGTDNCAARTTCAPDTPTDIRADTGKPVSERDAKAAAAPVLKALGQDDAKLDARQLMGAVRVVNAQPEVGGLPTYGWTTGVQIGAGGEVVGGSGQLKAPAKSATYPVLGARETLDLLNKEGSSRVGIGGCATPVPHEDRPEAPCGTGSTTELPQQAAIDVTDATFGLAAQSVAGQQALVPSWLFTVEPRGAGDAFTVTYPAVDPAYLAAPKTPATPQEPAKPAEPPSGNGDTVTSTVPVDWYTVSGSELTLHFTAGVCSTYEASASASGDQVTVKVTGTSEKDAICVAMAVMEKRTVRLDAPLGDRTVVDTHGKAVAKSAPKGTPRVR